MQRTRGLRTASPARCQSGSKWNVTGSFGTRGHSTWIKMYLAFKNGEEVTGYDLSVKTYKAAAAPAPSTSLNMLTHLATRCTRCQKRGKKGGHSRFTLSGRLKKKVLPKPPRRGFVINKQTYPMTRMVWFPCLTRRLAHASWDDRATGVVSQAAARADQTGPGRCCRRRRRGPLKADGTWLQAIKVTGQCLIASEDNLMFLLLFAQSAAARSLQSSPSRARLLNNSNYWSSSEGTSAGGTPTNADRTAATRQHISVMASFIWEINGASLGRCSAAIQNTQFSVRWRISTPHWAFSAERQLLFSSFFLVLIYCYFNLVTCVEPGLLAQETDFSTAFPHRLNKPIFLEKLPDQERKEPHPAA